MEEECNYYFEEGSYFGEGHNTHFGEEGIHFGEGTHNFEDKHFEGGNYLEEDNYYFEEDIRNYCRVGVPF